jgi:hypothetical protein
VIGDLGAAAPTLTKLTKQTAPFASATRTSLLSLGDAAAKSTKPLVQSDPVVVDLRDLARATVSPSKNLQALLSTLKLTGGDQQLLKFLYNTAGSVNAFDKFGHILRANLLVTSCVDYTIIPTTGCGAKFTGPGSASGLASAPVTLDATGTSAPAAGTVPATKAKAAAAGAAARSTLRGAANVLDFLVGPSGGNRARHRHDHGGVSVGGTVQRHQQGGGNGGVPLGSTPPADQTVPGGKR